MSLEKTKARLLAANETAEELLSQVKDLYVEEIRVMVNKFCRDSKRHFLIHYISDVASYN